MWQEINMAEGVIVVRTGWMHFYCLATEELKRPLGAAAFLKEKTGSEVHNFRPCPDGLLGFANTGGKRDGYNLKRIDPDFVPDPAEEYQEMDDVLVILCAPRNGVGPVVIVGWYDGATVYDACDERSLEFKGMQGWYNIWADLESSVLLPKRERRHIIPQKAKGTLGRAGVWYSFDKKGRKLRPRWLKDALRFVENYDGLNLLGYRDPNDDEYDLPESDGQGREQDPKKRKAVENHAMKMARQHFEKRRYTVRDVSANRPYDLDCRKGKEIIRVEVKGTTGKGEAVNLTAGGVKTARTFRGETVLFIVFEIQVKKGGSKVTTSGGKKRVLPRWKPSEGRLVPTNYRYRVPKKWPK